MVYVHGQRRKVVEDLRLRRQLERAAVEGAEAELAELAVLEADLARLQRRKERVASELRASRERTKVVRVGLRLAEPLYGGHEGLLMAVRECKEFQERKELEARKRSV